MGVLDWINPINKITNIIDKAVPDKDLRAELKSQLDNLKEQSYQIELQSKTIPWVDAIHKMGRQIITLVNLIVGAGLAIANVDPQVIFAIMGAGSVYSAVKGRGR